MTRLRERWSRFLHRGTFPRERVISALVCGNTTVGEIADTTGLEPVVVEEILDDLWARNWVRYDEGNGGYQLSTPAVVSAGNDLLSEVADDLAAQLAEARRQLTEMRPAASGGYSGARVDLDATAILRQVGQ